MKTLFVGQNCIYLSTIDSTNSYASELLKATKPPEGTLIYTFEQQNGRGQRGNTWHSEPTKNGAFSYILYPSFLQADEQFLLTQMTSLAVTDLMAELLQNTDKMQEIKIKWPNDIYVGNQKIAGILIENSLRDKNIQHAIIGIGLNINQTLFSGEFNATSLALLTKSEFNLKEIMNRLCDFIEARYLQLKSNKTANLNNAYLKRLYRLNEWHQYQTGENRLEGKITGVSYAGKLEMELKNGQQVDFNLKEIQFL
jgi:BirA family biotin operon repressor/biotin-[acetyl-CoA-carboxylase] ligase